MEPVVTIVIPVFNKWELTHSCLHSIKANTPQELFCVTVVDNGSSDATSSALPEVGQQLFGDAFTYIRFEENRNFAPACNAGVASAKTPYVFLLNNDTLVHENWFPPLYQAFSLHSNLGAVGPLLLYEDGSVQHLGVCFSGHFMHHLYKGIWGEDELAKKERRVQILSGAALFLTKETYQTCGGLHEGYKNGCEDIELSVRIRQLGKELRTVPSSVITHLESQTPQRFLHDDHNFLLLMTRCGKEIFPDFHTHALRDNLDVFLDDTLEVRCKYAAPQRTMLWEQVKDFSLAEWKSFLQKHFLWLEGHEQYALLLQRHERWQDAFVVWQQIMRMAPRRKSFQMLLECVRHFADEALVRKVEEERELFWAKTTPSVCLRQKTTMLRLAQVFGDKYLTQLYTSI